MPHEGFHRASGQKTSRPIDPRGTYGSTPFELVVQPVGGTRAHFHRNVCAAHMHVGNAQSTQMNHRRSTKTSSRCPEWPRGSRDATPRRAHPPFSSTYISALCTAVNARTIVSSAAAPAHDPMGPRDARRRQDITYSRSTGPLCAELELGRPLVPL